MIVSGTFYIKLKHWLVWTEEGVSFSGDEKVSKDLGWIDTLDTKDGKTSEQTNTL